MWMEEQYKSRDGQRGQNGSSYDLIYYTGEESDEVVAEDYVIANAPTTYRNLPRRTLAHEQITSDIYKWTITYGIDSKGTEQPVLEFNIGGGTIHITNSISNTRYRDAAVLSLDVNYGGAIGVELNDDGTKARVRGVEVQSPIMDYSYGQLFSTDDVTTAYIDDLYSLALNPVNDADFYGRPAGSVLFKGARGSKKGDDFWDIRFDFSYSPNETGLTIGNITGVAKDGWDYIDVLHVPNGRTPENFRILVPGLATVHRVYSRGDFSILGIGT